MLCEQALGCSVNTLWNAVSKLCDALWASFGTLCEQVWDALCASFGMLQSNFETLECSVSESCDQDLECCVVCKLWDMSELWDVVIKLRNAHWASFGMLREWAMGCCEQVKENVQNYDTGIKQLVHAAVIWLDKSNSTVGIVQVKEIYWGHLVRREIINDTLMHTHIHMVI